MVSRPLLRILPIAVVATALFGAPGTALANSAPTCVPIVQSVAPNTTRQVVLLKPFSFCTDPDHDLLSYSVLPNPNPKGTLDTTNLDEGSFTYTPLPAATGDDSLSLVAIDPSGLRSAPVTITMRITTANQAPICLDDPVVYPVAKNKAQGQLLTGHCYDPDALDNDGAPEHTPLYNIVPPPPQHGVVGPSSGGFAYKPDHDYTGPDTIHYTMTDAEGATSVQAGSTLVNVVSANAPVCSPQSVTQRPGLDVTFQTTCSDGITPINQLQYDLVPGTGPANLQWINNKDGTFTLHPLIGGAFLDSFSYTATSFAGVSNPANVSVNYQAGFNSPPVCTSLNPNPMFAHASRPQTFTFQCSDPQQDTFTVTGTNGTHGNLSPIQAAGNIYTTQYTPTNPNYEGPDTVSINAQDSLGAAMPSAVSVDFTVVSDANEMAPACDPGSIKVHNNDTQGVIYAPACTDGENDPLTASFTGAPGETPQHGVVTGPDANGAFTYVPNASYVGSDSFVVHVTDQIKTTTVNVAVTVLPPNHPPTCSNLSVPANHSGPTTFNLLAQCSDPDAGDTITAVLDSPPANGALGAVTADGHVTYTPNNGFAGGPDTFTYHVFDTSGATSGTATATVHVDQLPTCAAPTGNVAVAHNKSVTITPCTDPDSDQLSYTSIADPGHGAISTSATGQLIYKPTVGYSGLDTFQVAATDGRGGTSNTITVNTKVAADGAPTCTAHTYTIASGGSQAVPLTCTDPDGDTVTPSIVRPPGHGFLGAIKNGSVTFTSTAGFGGADSFTYRATDSDPSHTASAAVTVAFTITGGTPVAPPGGQPLPPTGTTPTTTTTKAPPPGGPGGEHGTTLKEIAEKILKHPAAQVDVGFGRTTVPAFVPTGVGGTLKVTGKSTVYLVYFCTCTITVNQVLSGGGTPHTTAAKKGTTTKATLNLKKQQASKVTLKLSAGQYKALTKGATITLKVTFTTLGPKPKNKKQKQKQVKKVRTFHVKAAKAKTKAKR
jgi:large repetitive protein